MGRFLRRCPPISPSREDRSRSLSAPEPPQPDFGAYARQGVASPAVSGYANQNGAVLPNPSAPPRSYTAPDFPNPFPPQQTYQPQPQSYQPQPQQNYGRSKAISRSPNSPTRAELPAAAIRPSRAVRAPSPAEAQFRPSLPAEPSPSRSFQDTGFPDRIFPAEAAQPPSYSEQGYTDTNYADASFGDASFPDASFPDASFPDASFPEEKAEQDYAAAPGHHDAFGGHESLHLDDATAPYGTEADPESFVDQSGHDYQAGHDYLRRRGIRRRASRVLCRRIRPCKPSMPSTTSRRRSRSAARNIQTKCRRRTRLKISTRATRATPTSSMKASS